jgi:hypothetical protein
LYASAIILPTNATLSNLDSVFFPVVVHTDIVDGFTGSESGGTGESLRPCAGASPFSSGWAGEGRRRGLLGILQKKSETVGDEVF